jgi:two-component system CheB/CheR fusion protein
MGKRRRLKRPPIALIVEDDRETGEVFEIALGAAGFVPFVVDSGETALTLMEGLLPDVVVLDLCLPGADGADVLTRLRAATRSAQVPVIVATGHPNLAESIHEEADLVLEKPVECIELQRQAIELVQLR